MASVSMRGDAYIVVCFRLDQKHSIHYAECETMNEIYYAVKKCIDEKADIISIRRFLR